MGNSDKNEKQKTKKRIEIDICIHMYQVFVFSTSYCFPLKQKLLQQLKTAASTERIKCKQESRFTEELRHRKLFNASMT